MTKPQLLIKKTQKLHTHMCMYVRDREMFFMWLCSMSKTVSVERVLSIDFLAIPINEPL